MTKILITSALPYINGVKHLGNLSARCCRPTCMPASAARPATRCCSSAAPTSTARRPSSARSRPAQDVRAYCDAQHAIQADVYRRFGLSFDHFGRTSAPQNHALTQHFYRRLDAAGLIEERSVPQVWSAQDRRFLPDRYVLGTCPHCRCASARGDQCDDCGALLDPIDLIRPALGAVRCDRPRGARQPPPVPAPVRAGRTPQCLARHAPRLAAFRGVAGAQLAHRGPARPLHHARSRLGRAGAAAGLRGQGVLCLVRRADRLHRGDARMGGA